MRRKNASPNECCTCRSPTTPHIENGSSRAPSPQRVIHGILGGNKVQNLTFGDKGRACTVSPTSGQGPVYTPSSKCARTLCTSRISVTLANLRCDAAVDQTKRTSAICAIGPANSTSTSFEARKICRTDPALPAKLSRSKQLHCDHVSAVACGVCACEAILCAAFGKAGRSLEELMRKTQRGQKRDNESTPAFDSCEQCRRRPATVNLATPTSRRFWVQCARDPTPLALSHRRSSSARS